MNPGEADEKGPELARATGSPSHIFSPSPTSTDRLISMQVSSAAVFRAKATAKVRLGTFRSRIAG
jgi:hypothetical protein